VSTPWLDERPFALALSHDVDRVAKRWQFPYYIGQAIARRRPDQLQRQIQSLGALARGDDPYWNFQRIMALEDEFGAPPSFFLTSRARPA
jgi:hypothetical protein